MITKSQSKTQSKIIKLRVGHFIENSSLAGKVGGAFAAEQYINGRKLLIKMPLGAD